MEETNKYLAKYNKFKKVKFSGNKKKIILKNIKLGLNLKDFLLFFLLILLVSSFILLFIQLKRLFNFSNNNMNFNMKITIYNHTNIEKKLNSYNKSFENYSKTLINLPIPSSDTRNHYFNIKEIKGVGICSICKNENLYLKEYVAYYQKLGIKKIIIYDNNDINGEKPEDVLQNFIKSNFVEILDIRGLKSVQFPSFNHCYKKYKNQFDYITFLDFDEFITIQNNKSINDYLYNSKYDKCESILLNWVMYGDNDLVRYDNRTVIERFTKPAQKWNRGKSIVRTSIDNLK